MLMVTVTWIFSSDQEGIIHLRVHGTCRTGSISMMGRERSRLRQMRCRTTASIHLSYYPLTLTTMGTSMFLLEVEVSLAIMASLRAASCIATTVTLHSKMSFGKSHPRWRDPG